MTLLKVLRSPERYHYCNEEGNVSSELASNSSSNGVTEESFTHGKTPTALSPVCGYTGARLLTNPLFLIAQVPSVLNFGFAYVFQNYINGHVKAKFSNSFFQTHDFC